VVPQQPPPAAAAAAAAAAPAAAAAADEQVVPPAPGQYAEPRSDTPGVMRTPRRTREARVAGQRRSPPASQNPPPRPSHLPLHRGPPLAHAMLIPSWAVVINDIWFTCPICTDEESHSGVACGQCGGRPACCA
jgi:hypothetical protein